MYAIKKTEMIPTCGSEKLEAVSYLTKSFGNLFYSMPYISGHEDAKIRWFLSRGEAIDYLEEFIFPEYREAVKAASIEVFFEIVDFIYITLAEEVSV